VTDLGVTSADGAPLAVFVVVDDSLKDDLLLDIVEAFELKAERVPKHTISNTAV
jgi:hypothetical protein